MMHLKILIQEIKMNKTSIDNLTRGIFRENPILVMLLGMCPTLGVSTSAINGLGMGLATMFVLMLSNIAISSIKKIIPDIIRIPSFIVIIASFVTILEMIMQAYLPMLYSALGIYIPLIVVNCIILGRAEAFASKYTIFQSLLDAIGMGIGFTISLTILGSVREILGNGSIFGYDFMGTIANPILLFIMPPGAFLALAGIIIVVNKFRGVK
jgi:electron transport complex protein RnfE